MSSERDNFFNVQPVIIERENLFRRTPDLEKKLKAARESLEEIAYCTMEVNPTARAIVEYFKRKAKQALDFMDKPPPESERIDECDSCDQYARVYWQSTAHDTPDLEHKNCQKCYDELFAVQRTKKT
jgi:hypothetical protein